MDQVKIGEFISKLRKEKNMTQEELGNLVGVTGKAVSRWETGNGVPDISIVNHVSEVLGVTTTELLNGERVTSLDEMNLDEITENSIDFYKSKLKTKFKKVCFIMLTIIFILLFLVTSIFLINNYNTCQVYSIKSDFSDVKLSGILSVTNNKNTLVIGNIEYPSSIIDNVKSIKYKLSINDENIYESGDLLVGDYLFSSKDMNFNDYLQSINIYINDFSPSVISKLSKFRTYIIFDVTCFDNTNHNISIPLKFNKDFSNTKLLYFK